MCKVLMFTNLTKVKPMSTLATKACEIVTRQDDDGYGYSVLTSKGMYGERTLAPTNFVSSFHKPILQVPFTDKSYERFGTKTKAVGPGLFHGRVSTNSVNLLNTHPINKHGWSLIHNGVVNNRGKQYEMTTTNDTEHILEYLATQGIGAVERNLTGYYAVGAIDPQGNLHVFRDGNATLYTAWIKDIDSFVFATTEDIITDLAEEMGWKSVSIIEAVSDNKYLIYKGNELIHCQDIKPLGWSYTESSLASKSLGRSLGPTKDDVEYFDQYGEEMLHKDVVAEILELEKEVAQSKDGSRSMFSNVGFSEDEQAFLDEVNHNLDGSYIVLDYNARPMNIQEFRDLEDDEKLYCTVIRHDGTVVDPMDYNTDRLYDGWYGTGTRANG